MGNFVKKKSKNGKLETRFKLIDEFYNEYQPENMSYKDFEAICKTPFLHMKKSMSTGKLYEFRFKYLGKFIPNPGLLVMLLRKSKTLLKLGKIDQTTYNLNVVTITDYMTKNLDEFESFKEELKEFVEL